ncbi:MAG TPA: GIY-YIG nuclease family protein [Pseudomonadales bacterium]|nr:GIY-YIG nuclease family protein [Pseudomonadales bacterium]
MNGGWFLYVVRCSDGSLYTGVTTDLERRIREHNTSKRGAKYTRSRRPVELQLSMPYSSRSEAQKAEARFKKLSKREKEKVIDEILDWQCDSQLCSPPTHAFFA